MEHFRTQLPAQAYFAVRTPINQLSFSVLMNQEPAVSGFLLFSSKKNLFTEVPPHKPVRWILYGWSARLTRTCNLWSMCENNGNHQVQHASQMVCFVSTTVCHIQNMNCCIFDKLHSLFLCSFSFQYVWLNHLSLQGHATQCQVVLPNTFWFSDIDTHYSLCLQCIVREHGYELQLSLPFINMILLHSAVTDLRLLASWILLTGGRAVYFDGVCLQH